MRNSCARARLQVGGEADVHARVVRRQLHQAVAVEALVRRALTHQPARGAAPEEQARLALPPGQALRRARAARIRLQAQALGTGVGYKGPTRPWCCLGRRAAAGAGARLGSPALPGRVRSQAQTPRLREKWGFARVPGLAYVHAPMHA